MTDAMVAPTPGILSRSRSPAPFRTGTSWRWCAPSTSTAALRPGLTSCPPSTSSLPPTAGRCRRQSWHVWPTPCCTSPTCTGSWWRTPRGGPLWSAISFKRLDLTTPTSTWRRQGTTRYAGTLGTPGYRGAPYRGTWLCGGSGRPSAPTAASLGSSTSRMMTTRTVWSCLRR